MIAAALAFLASACVPQGRYDEAVKTADAMRIQCQQGTNEAQAHAETDRRRIEHLNDEVHAAEARLAAAEPKEQELLRRLDEKTVLSDTLRGELGRAVENEAVYKGLALRLKAAVDTGELVIVVRAGRMVLRLPNDVLFDSGQAELKPAGKRTLGRIASVLGTVAGRRFQIAGHTDSVAIQRTRFHSNWELSSARAIEVVRFLSAEGGIKPTLLSAAGYGEFDPIASNDAEGGRAKNRRIEITLQPDIKEIVSVPDRN